jgi:hypothetical protein
MWSRAAHSASRRARDVASPTPFDDPRDRVSGRIARRKDGGGKKNENEEARAEKKKPGG